MARNIFQDVVPPNRKSIRDIPLGREPKNNHAKQSRGGGRENKETENFGGGDNWPMKYSVDESPVNLPEGRGKTGGSAGWIIWVLGLVSAGALVFFLGNFFAGAEVVVIQKKQPISFNIPLTAKIDAPKGELSYVIYSMSKEAEISVPADSVKMLETKASGTIIVYNNFSSASQRLINNTRFQTPDGLIYRINQSITVPGRITSGGKTTPGSIEVVVFADTAGDEYNIGLTDFTIPGFKSNPERFKSFFARSKTAMSGGKIGPAPSVSDDKLKMVKVTLEKDLEKQLLEEARKNVPADSVFWDDGRKVFFEMIPVMDKGNSKEVILRERAILRAFFFKKADIALAIAKNNVQGFDGALVSYYPEDAVIFELKNKSNFKPASVGPISFDLKGTTSIIWQFDLSALKESLVGKTKDELAQVVRDKFPGILSAEVIFRPFWKNAFPDSPNKIKIKISNGGV